jgi:hypothetical protein
VLVTPVLADTVEKIPAPDTVSPGFAGFLMVFLLALATVLLIRSMVKHLRKVNHLPEPPDPDQGSDPDQPHPQRPGNVVDDQRVDTGVK